MNRCALFLEADPFTKSDLQVIKSLLKTFGYVDIILDRKQQLDNYTLSFVERSDIIKHDLKEQGIENYQIHANDTSKYDSVFKNVFKNVAIIISNHSNLDEIFARTKILKGIINDINIIFVPVFDDCISSSKQFIHRLVLEDFTNKAYVNYLSDYTYLKTKIKLVKKVGVTGIKDCGMPQVLEVFEEKGYDVVNLDKIITDLSYDDEFSKSVSKKLNNKKTSYCKNIVKINQDGKYTIDRIKFVKYAVNDQYVKNVFMESFKPYAYKVIADAIMKTHKKSIVIGFTLIYELNLNSLFDKIICVHTNKQIMEQRLKKSENNYTDEEIIDVIGLQMDMEQKLRYSDYYIDANTDNDDILKRNANSVITRKIERDLFNGIN